MRKVVAWGICAGTALALAASGLAVGGNVPQREYKGDILSGGIIKFRLVEGRNPRVNHIKVKGIPAKCDRGTGKLTYRIYKSTPVRKDGTFEVRSNDSWRGHAHVTGDFSDDRATATGTVRVWGKFRFPEQGAARCDSERQTFSAAERQ